MNEQNGTEQRTFFTNSMLLEAFPDWINNRYPAARHIGDVAVARVILAETDMPTGTSFGALRQHDDFYYANALIAFYGTSLA